MCSPPTSRAPGCVHFRQCSSHAGHRTFSRAVQKGAHLYSTVEGSSFIHDVTADPNISCKTFEEVCLAAFETLNVNIPSTASMLSACRTDRVESARSLKRWSIRTPWNTSAMRDHTSLVVTSPRLKRGLRVDQYCFTVASRTETPLGFKPAQNVWDLCFLCYVVNSAVCE